MIPISISNYYRQLPTSKQIAISISLIMALTALLVTISLVAQLNNIKGYQQELPNKYLSSTNQKSLLAISLSVRYLILDILDIRRGLLNYVRLALLSKQSVLLNQTQTININSSMGSSSKMQCLFTINGSNFTCSMHSYADFLVLNSDIYMSIRPLKRFNIYYQNIWNPNDIMVKSLSHETISNVNISKVTQKMNSVKVNQFMFSSFYQDEYREQDSFTIALRTKLKLENYTVLLQAQDYGTFLKRTITRVLYTDNSNILIFMKNCSNPQGYTMVSNLKDLHPELNYSKFLKAGYSETVLNNGSLIYSYVEDFSHVYPVDERINDQQSHSGHTKQDTEDYFLVVYSSSATEKISNKIYGFITNIFHRVLQFILIGFLCILAIIILITLFVVLRINKGLYTARNKIRQYTRNPKEYMHVLHKLLQFYTDGQIFKLLIRKIYEIIKMIEHKKKKFSNPKWKQNQYPLNLLESSFIQNQKFNDIENLHRFSREMQKIHSI